MEISSMTSVVLYTNGFTMAELSQDWVNALRPYKMNQNRDDYVMGFPRARLRKTRFNGAPTAKNNTQVIRTNGRPRNDSIFI
jgi:hypothetical protein